MDMLCHHLKYQNISGNHVFVVKVKSKREIVFYDWVNAMNLHSTDKILSLLSEDIKINSTMFGHWNGKSNVKEFLCDVFSAFPNLFINPVAVFSNDVGIMASELYFGGTQTGKFNGNPGLGINFTLEVFLSSISMKMTRLMTLGLTMTQGQ